MFHKWEAVEGTLREEVMFPRPEALTIQRCGSLSALPKGPFVGAETTMAVEGTLREKVMFP